MAENKDAYPWVDGNYKGSGLLEAVILNGDSATFEDYPDVVMKFKHGDFGEADAEVAEATGLESYNVESTYNMFGQQVTEHGVVHGDGRKFNFKTFWMGLWTLEWITPEEALKQANDGDSIEAPPSHYKLEPERQGKLLWVTGPPGVGKSTTAQLLSSTAGYVYYEGNCFFTCQNPYISSDAPDPAIAQMDQRKLLGKGLKERREVQQKMDRVYEARMAGKDFNMEDIENAYKLMCEDIAKERKRMGGDWVIATVVDCCSLRDFVRSQLGPELQFVVLDMAMEDALERIKARHKGDENAIEIFKVVYALCEPAGENEPNTLDVKVTPDMNSEDVIEKIQKMLK